jgi:phage terminase large subunit GpA-like protein
MYKQFETDTEFMTGLINSIVTSREFKLPSEYIESVRYLPKELSPKHGFFDYNYTPYLREIVDNFSPLSNVRETVFMKSVQIGATTGALEGVIAYCIGCVPKPQLYISADKELVEKGMEVKVDRMIDGCDLRHLIKPQTGVKTKKTGDRKTEKDYPGGFLHAIGAQSPGKLRSMNYPVLLFDELDGMPDKLKNEGDPVSLAKNRCLIPYEEKGKILYISTPLVMQTSKIYALYLQGDQRNYFVPCIHCGEQIVLYWHLRESQTKTGLRGGIIYDVTESGKLIKQSVRYKCQECGGEMENHHKSIILVEGEWRPTVEAKKDRMRSYWLNALYSPVGMFSWAGMVESFAECWDLKNNKLLDREGYRDFRNTKQGLPFEEMGEAPKYERIIRHQRHYAKNTIPNKLCIADNGFPILFLIASADVQKTCIYFDIKGYTVGGRSYTIDFRQIDGDPQDLNDPCWNALSDIIEFEKWESDDGKTYKIQTTFITVYEFCAMYSVGVYPQIGERYLNGGLTIKKASKETVEKAGCWVYKTNTTLLKDRIAKSFRQDWESGEDQPLWRPNFPDDFRDDYFRQFESEYKAPIIDTKTKKPTRQFVWTPIGHRENHAWDTFVYNLAGLEQFAESVCLAEKYDEEGKEIGLELESLNWAAFWEFAVKQKYYVDKYA